MNHARAPQGYQAVTPYLVVDDIDQFVEFTRQVFGIRIHEKLTDETGAARHAEILIGDSMLMVGRRQSEWPAMPASLYVYVDDVDSVHQAALHLGATEIMPPMDMFYGDRQGGITDPQGNVWWISTRIESLSPDELQRRAAAAWKKD